MKQEPTLLRFSPCFAAILILSVSLSLAAQTQDIIYLVDETPITGDIVEVSGKRVKYKKESGQLKSYDAKQITMLFNESGSFLIFPAVQLTDEAAGDFMKATAKPSVDLLITLDKQVIPGLIISANEHEVMYQDTRQQSGERSIGKDVLALIIFKNGQHELLVSPSQASEILYATKDAIEKLKAPSIVSTTTENKSQAKQEPKSIGEGVNSTAVDMPAGATTQQKTQETSTATVDPRSNSSADFVLSEKELSKLKGAALQKVQELSAYIKLLSTPDTDRAKVKQTIDLACALFVDEEARVEVANVQTGVKNKYKIRDYLNRLSLQKSQHGKNNIEYANINYAATISKSPDGNYSRQIEYMQTFTGLSTGKIVYSELTKRKAGGNEKILSEDEAETSKQPWDVFLSDIGVVETPKF